MLELTDYLKDIEVQLDEQHMTNYVKITLDDKDKGPVKLSEQQLKALEKLSSLTLKQLKEAGVFIYPDINAQQEADKEKRGVTANSHLLQITHDKLSTNNLVGFVSYEGEPIVIRSRFAPSSGNDCFLHYLMLKTLKFTTIDLPMPAYDAESILDLLPLLFPSYLTRAVSQGIFRQYQRRHYNDSRPKGTIAVARHLKVNVPFQGNVAYDTRELTYDNPVTQLVRHTIEVLRSKPQFSDLLTSSPEVATAVRQIELATPSFARAQLAAVVKANHRPCSHPLLTEYQPLQQLCLKILRHEELGLRFTSDDDAVYGIIFDSAYLWEEYLATLLELKGFEHPRNQERSGAIYLTKDTYYPLYPDFYRQTSDEPTADLVLDAKYKRYEDKENKPSSDDIKQMALYMFLLKAPKAVLLCPTQDQNPSHWHFNLRSYGGTIDVKFLSIPQEELTFENFALRMADAEKQLLDELAKL